MSSLLRLHCILVSVMKFLEYFMCPMSSVKQCRIRDLVELYLKAFSFGASSVLELLPRCCYDQC